MPRTQTQKSGAVRRRWLPRVCLTALSLVLCLAVLELLLRVGVVGNSLEHRLRLQGDTSAPRLKVMFVGDSFLAQGMDGTSLPEVLSGWLAERKVNVHNAAVSGMGPLHYRDELDLRAPGYRPDLVVVSYYAGNDLTDVVAVPARRTGLAADLGRGLRRLARRAHLFYFYRDMRNALLTRTFSQQELLAMGITREESEQINPALVLTARDNSRHFLDNLLLDSAAARAAWRRTEAALDHMRARCRALGARMVLVVFPMSAQVSRQHFDLLSRMGFTMDRRLLGSGEPQRRLARYATNHGVPMLDLLPAFRAHRGPGLFLKNDEHLGEAGNRFAAAQILRFLLARTAVGQGAR